MNWESVKYFTSEHRESARYAKAINDYQTIELRVIGSLNALNLVQNAIITSGLLAGTLIVAYRVTKGTATAAEFVVFLTYLGQLYGPLNMLGEPDQIRPFCAQSDLSYTRNRNDLSSTECRKPFWGASSKNRSDFILYRVWSMPRNS